MKNKGIEEIKKVIQKSYIQGIHEEQDAELVNDGFHPEFRMLVNDENQLKKVDRDEWLDRIPAMKKELPKVWDAETKHNIKSIDISGKAASVKMDVFKGEVHFSTDYMLLYAFKKGWKIVSKIYAIPPF